MNNKIEFFKECIKSKDPFALVEFISNECETEEDLINICKKSQDITTYMISEIISVAVDYINKSNTIIKHAKKLSDSGILNIKTKEKLDNIIKNEISSTTNMGYKLQYFIEVIEKNI